jgi:eukaryotic-like serine/threonine-protein kinase
MARRSATWIRIGEATCRNERRTLKRALAALGADFHHRLLLGHPGVILNQPIGALAHLGLGRAYVLQGNTAKAKAAYQDFLTLWKDADPDIPILRQAQAEYAKLP